MIFLSVLGQRQICKNFKKKLKSLCYLGIKNVYKIFQNNITVHESIFTGKLLTIHHKSSLLNLHFENQASQTTNLVCYCSAVVSRNRRLFNFHWKPLKFYYFKTIRSLLFAYKYGKTYYEDLLDNSAAIFTIFFL